MAESNLWLYAVKSVDGSLGAKSFSVDAALLRLLKTESDQAGDFLRSFSAAIAALAEHDERQHVRFKNVRVCWLPSGYEEDFVPIFIFPNDDAFADANSTVVSPIELSWLYAHQVD